MIETLEPIQKIVVDGQTLAIIIRAFLPFEGYNFPSDPNDSLQVGVNHYRAGQKIANHYHLPVERNINNTLEVVHIEKGKVDVCLFNDKQEPVYQCPLVSGDTIILLSGGHGFEVHDDTRIIEVKQGPYLSAAIDKVKF